MIDLVGTPSYPPPKEGVAVVARLVARSQALCTAVTIPTAWLDAAKDLTEIVTALGSLQGRLESLSFCGVEILADGTSLPAFGDLLACQVTLLNFHHHMSRVVRFEPGEALPDRAQLIRDAPEKVLASCRGNVTLFNAFKDADPAEPYSAIVERVMVTDLHAGLVALLRKN